MKHIADIFDVREITEHQADLIKSFAMFYLLLIGQFLTPALFTCFEENYITHHKSLQFVLSFLVFYFLVTVVSNTGSLNFTPPIEKLLYSLFYFVGFLVVMRLDMRVTLCVLFLIFIIYFMEINKTFYLTKTNLVTEQPNGRENENNKYWITINWPVKLRLFPVNISQIKLINKIESVIYYIIISLLIVGFISYGGEIKETFDKKNSITWLEILMKDSRVCSLKHKHGFWYYFRKGLRLPF